MRKDINFDKDDKPQFMTTKKVWLFMASVFLAYRSVELLKFLSSAHPTQFNWLGAMAFSFALNLFITGIFALLGFAFLTSTILPNAYYKIKNAKNLNLIYNILGVDYFKWLLLHFFWGKERHRKKYFNGSKTGIHDFDMQTRQSEFGHLAAFLTIAVVSFYLLLKGYVLIFCLTNVINLVGNLYPIILQRTHRIQIERLQLLMDKRK